jgi:hypothetical protein
MAGKEGKAGEAFPVCVRVHRITFRLKADREIPQLFDRISRALSYWTSSIAKLLSKSCSFIKIYSRSCIEFAVHLWCFGWCP